MRILILDDHPLFAKALEQIVINLENNTVVDQADDTNKAQQLFNNGKSYDLILVDLALPGMDGFGFLRWLQSQYIRTPVIIISANNDANISERAIQQGAKGFIHKSEDTRIILDAMQHVLQGKTYQPNKPTSSQLNNSSDKDDIAISLGITGRQLVILKLIERGLSNKEIARELKISDSTVKSHISNIFSTLHVQNRTACVTVALSLGLL